MTSVSARIDSAEVEIAELYAERERLRFREANTPGKQRAWFGPIGVGVERHEWRLRLWLPSLSWVWGYWR